MIKTSVDIKKIFKKSDIFTIIVIICGFLLAAIVDEIALKLIGVSLGILGIVRLVLFVSNRINILINNNKLRTNSSQTNYQYTEKQDNKAKRVVIEDYHSVKKEAEEKSKDYYTNKITEDEGFRLVDEPKSTDEKPEVEESDKTIKTGITSNTFQDDFEFEDEFSGIKIISKDKPKKENSSVTEPLKLKSESEKQVLKNDEIVENKNFKSQKIDLPMTELLEADPAFSIEPRKEFEFFLTRILKLIRTVTNTKTAVFLLVNNNDRELIVEAFDSKMPGAIAVRKRIRFGKDIVTQIVESNKPEILLEINTGAELDLIPYYVKSVGTSSFFGIPVFYQGAVVGVLCADSEIINAYDTSVVHLFGQYAKLISGLVKSYTEKYDMLQDSKTLEAINHFRSIMNQSNLSISYVLKAIIEAVITIKDKVSIGIVFFDKSPGEWILADGYKINKELLNQKIDIHKSLIADTLLKNRTVYKSQFADKEIRVMHNEARISKGFYISAPLASYTNTYGALFIEGTDENEISQFDVKIIETLAANASIVIEQIYFSEIIKSSAIFDPSTGLLNTPAFQQRLNEEILKGIDLKYHITLCLIEIDKYKSIDPKDHLERSEQVLMHIIETIQNKLKPYDIFGRADSNIFGIGLINMNIDKAKIWAEKLRTKIAQSLINIGDDSFNVTISIGIATAHANESADDILDNARKVLDISKQRTNTLTVFE